MGVMAKLGRNDLFLNNVKNVEMYYNLRNTNKYKAWSMINK